MQLFLNSEETVLGDTPTEWAAVADGWIDDYREGFCRCHLGPQCGYHFITDNIAADTWWERRYALFWAIADLSGADDRWGIEAEAHDYAADPPGFLRDQWETAAARLIADHRAGLCQCRKELGPCGPCDLATGPTSEAPGPRIAYLVAAAADGYNDRWAHHLAAAFADHALYTTA